MPYEWVREIARLVLYVAGLVAFAAFNAAYLSLLERKEPAWFQLRRGPTEAGPLGLLQPVADGIKLLGKQLLVQRDADVLLFKLAPVAVVVPSVMCLVTIPFSETIGARD